MKTHKNFSLFLEHILLNVYGGKMFHATFVAEDEITVCFKYTLSVGLWGLR
jgi:hypothetical protein